MREAIAALESALRELGLAKDELPEDLGAELAGIIDETRAVLESLQAKSPAGPETS